jgi:hypothetical protein
VSVYVAAVHGPIAAEISAGSRTRAVRIRTLIITNDRRIMLTAIAVALAIGALVALILIAAIRGVVKLSEALSDWTKR